MSDARQADAPSAARRLSDERVEELYAVVRELLEERGYDALTLDAVAARARTGKATLYRQWQGKPGLVLAALQHEQALDLSDIDTGSLVGDLHVVARRLGEVAGHWGALLAAMVHATLRDPELGAAVRESVIAPAQRQLDEVLDRAQVRGELAPGPAREYVADALASSVISRPLLVGQPADPEHLVRFVDAVVLPALTAGTSR